MFLLYFFISTHKRLANTTEKFPGSNQMTCNILWSHPTQGTTSLGGSTFILYSLVLGFAIPLSLILVFYYLVIKKLQTVGPKVRMIFSTYFFSILLKALNFSIEQIEGQKTVTQKSNETCSDRHFCLHPFMGSLLGTILKKKKHKITHEICFLFFTR